MYPSREFWEKAQAIDRRWVFLFIALAVIVPLIFQPTCKAPATPEVRTIYDKIEALEPGSRVLLSLDFDPPSEPELLPMAMSYTRHLALRGHHIYFMTLWPLGQQEVETVINDILLPEFGEGYEYGINYVSLGFKTGNEGVIQGLLGNFVRTYPTDAAGTSVAELPMMEGIRTLRDMDLILNVSAGYPGITQWIQFGSDPADVPIAAGVTAVSAPLLYPYYPRQMLGLMGGLQAAAEFETLVREGYPERYAPLTCEEAGEAARAEGSCRQPAFAELVDFPAQKRMGPQTVAHLVIIFFIILGNIAYFATRRGSGNRLRSVR